jgi:isoleucyl-tRNA synthetase
VIRLVQEARKNAGFEVSDRITLTWHADGEIGAPVAQALDEHHDLVAGEVLATTMTEASAADGLDQSDEGLGLAFSVVQV